MVQKIMDFSNDLTIDEISDYIRRSVEAEEHIVIKADMLSHELELYVELVLTNFLETIGQGHLKDYAFYCVKELMVNAKKANTKRVYFLEKGLDINNREDYRKGMKHFETETEEKTEHYLTLQRRAGLLEELHIGKQGNDIILEVWNNTELTALEGEQILGRIKAGEQYAHLEDALGEVEGTGLIILIWMLKKLEVWDAKKSITVKKDNGNTIVRVTIPMKQKK